MEYYDKNKLLIKYIIYNDSSPQFDVSIFYSDSKIPYKVIEYFPDLHHSENGLFSIQYDLNYNAKNELVEIIKTESNGYECRIKKSD